MDRFISEQIEVEQSPTSPRPVRFWWRGQCHDVAEVISVRVDGGHGDLPARSRRWFTRRHRRYYTVKDTDGNTFELYLDYANRARKVWQLVKQLES